MNKLKSAVFAAAMLAASALLPVVASQDAGPSKEGLEATIAALQTQAAELEPDGDRPVAGTPAAGSSWNTETTAGTGFDVLVPAPADTVDVIAVGTYDGQRLPFVVHNNTSTAADSVSVSGAVLDDAGDLFATGGAIDVNPGWIASGGIGVGYLYFDGIEFPPEVTVELTLTHEAVESRGSVSSLEATVDEWNQIDDRIVGFLTNPHSSEIIGPISVNIVCLNEDGSVASYNDGYTDSETIPVGGRIPFQVNLDQSSCDLNLIVADGWNF